MRILSWLESTFSAPFSGNTPTEISSAKKRKSTRNLLWFDTCRKIMKISKQPELVPARIALKGLCQKCLHLFADSEAYHVQPSLFLSSHISHYFSRYIFIESYLTIAQVSAIVYPWLNSSLPLRCSHIVWCN